MTNDLGKFEECPHCHRFDFANEHRCPPQWRVQIYELDLSSEVHATTAEKAAEQVVLGLEDAGRGDEYEVVVHQISIAIADAIGATIAQPFRIPDPVCFRIRCEMTLEARTEEIEGEDATKLIEQAAKVRQW